MVDNRTDSGSSGEERKRNRRYLRNRKRPRRGPGGREQEGAEPQRVDSAAAPSQAGEQPRQRRRRRTRRESPADGPADLGGKVVDLDYVAPASVFIYTHIVRSGLRDMGYEFRSERFGDTGVGRRLEDYRLDLSVLFPEEGAAVPDAANAAIALKAADDSDYDDYDDYDDDDDYDNDDDGDAYEDADASADEDEDDPLTAQDGV